MWVRQCLLAGDPWLRFAYARRSLGAVFARIDWSLSTYFAGPRLSSAVDVHLSALRTRVVRVRWLAAVVVERYQRRGHTWD